jgi:hypothetical protein
MGVGALRVVLRSTRLLALANFIAKLAEQQIWGWKRLGQKEKEKVK